jgi:hypothetical protein
MKKNSQILIDKKEITKFRNANEINVHNLNLNEAKDDKNEHLKLIYLKKITNHYNFLDLKEDENFQNLIVYLIDKEKKEDIDQQILINYLIHLDEVVEMLKASNENFIDIIHTIATNLSSEKLGAHKLVFRQGPLN